MGTDAPLCDISEDKIVEFETAVMPIPQFDPENPKMISQGPSVCIFNKEDPQEVMASWLFTQYLLSNEVQIAYAETEGYVPVTSKAQRAAEYQDYLTRCGEDNATYYDIKIKAAELLMDNVDHTFVTPVFNGSASLRSAAGQLIENTVKSARRGEQIDEAYMTGLYSDIQSLYRLDQLENRSSVLPVDRKSLGRLPTTAIVLIASLLTAWTLILLCVALRVLKKGKKDKNRK